MSSVPSRKQAQPDGCLPSRMPHLPDEERPDARLPGFGYTNPACTCFHCSPAWTGPERAVRQQGYLWVQTNNLVPWVQGVTRATTPDNIGANPPARLNPHGHHGPNTHRIVRGRLTLTSVDPHHDITVTARESSLTPSGATPKTQTQTQAHTLTISDNGIDPISAPVDGGVVYEGRTDESRGCTFVEGHYCLSPTTALRFMQRGTLKWFGADGVPLPETDQEYVKEQLRTAIVVPGGDGGKDEEDQPGFVSFRMRGRRQVAREMTAWFEEEWADLENLMMCDD